MSRYRRAITAGGTFFFTVVAYRRQPILCDAAIRIALREAVFSVRRSKPFVVDAWVLLPDHLHCVWTLPLNDNDFRALVTHQELGEPGGWVAIPPWGMAQRLETETP